MNSNIRRKGSVHRRTRTHGEVFRSSHPTQLTVPPSAHPNQAAHLARTIHICKGLSVDLEWRRFFCPYLGYGGERLCVGVGHQKGTMNATFLLGVSSRASWDSPPMKAAGSIHRGPNTPHYDLWECILFEAQGDVPGGLPMTSGAARSMKRCQVHPSTSTETERDLDFPSLTRPALRS